MEEVVAFSAPKSRVAASLVLTEAGGWPGPVAEVR